MSQAVFKVVVSSSDITSPDYIDRVVRFQQGTADPENLSASLVARSVSGTQPPKGLASLHMASWQIDLNTDHARRIGQRRSDRLP